MRNYYILFFIICFCKNSFAQYNSILVRNKIFTWKEISEEEFDSLKSKYVKKYELDTLMPFPLGWDSVLTVKCDNGDSVVLKSVFISGSETKDSFPIEYLNNEGLIKDINYYHITMSSPNPYDYLISKKDCKMLEFIGYPVFSENSQYFILSKYSHTDTRNVFQMWKMIKGKPELIFKADEEIPHFWYTHDYFWIDNTSFAVEYADSKTKYYIIKLK